MQMAGGYSQVHECEEGCIKKLKMTMEGTTTSGAFTGATLAEKLNKLNSSQQSIESIFLKCIIFFDVPSYTSSLCSWLPLLTPHYLIDKYFKVMYIPIWVQP